MAEIVMVGMVSFLATGLLWYCYFYQKEKKLLQRLHNIIEQAEAGSSGSADIENTVLPQVISEEKISCIEGQFRRFVKDSLLENEKNQQQKQVIQGLISDISHQTLTPIANLKLYAELLQEIVCSKTDKILARNSNTDEVERNASALSEITVTLCEQTEKLDFLIQSLVKLSRMETGLIGVHPQKESVQKLLDTVQRAYRKKATEKKIALVFVESGLQACFDLKWTVEVLGNIVENAVKYTQTGGTVQVSARAYTFFVRIDVVDNGIGITGEETAKIFTRFYRSLSVENQPGVGIGLYLAREIVQAQRGYIKVSSKVGEGSVFSVFLPAVDGAEING